MPIPTKVKYRETGGTYVKSQVLPKVGNLIEPHGHTDSSWGQGELGRNLLHSPLTPPLGLQEKVPWHGPEEGERRRKEGKKKRRRERGREGKRGRER